VTLNATMHRISRLEGAYEQIAGRLDSIDGRLTAIEGRFGAIDGRFGAIDGRFGVIDGRLASIEAKIESRFAWMMTAVLSSWMTVLLAVVGFGFEIIHAGR
jgi:hypothetical protein